MSQILEERTVRLILNHRANLSSSLRRSLRRAARDLEDRNITVESFVTESPLDAEQLAREACTEGHAAVIAVGGDGTLHQVINGVMMQDRECRSEVTVGLIPAGTANDFASCLGLRSCDAYRILMALTEERVKWLDLGKLQSRYFINVATGGFGADATRNLSPSLKSLYGAKTYFLNGAFKLLTTLPHQVRFQSGDWHWEGRALAFAVGNGKQAGGGCMLCPEAQLDDGELDLCIIPFHVEIHKLLTSWVNGPTAAIAKLLTLQNPLRHGVLGYLLEYYKELVVRKKVTSLDIQFEQAPPLNLDGEPTEFDKELNVAVLPQKLKFLVPSL